MYWKAFQYNDKVIQKNGWYSAKNGKWFWWLIRISSDLRWNDPHEVRERVSEKKKAKQS